MDFIIDFSNPEIINSNISQFLSQQRAVENFIVVNSRLGSWPEQLEVTKLDLEELNEFQVEFTFVNFISNSPKSFVSLKGFFTDADLVSLDKKLGGDKKILLDTFEEQVSDFGFYRVDITTVPDGFFSTKNFVFVAERVSLNLENIPLLRDLPLDLFSGQVDTLVELSFSNSNGFQKVPLSVFNLNLAVLDISNTGIENFAGLDFSGFQSLERIVLNDSPIEEFCEDEKNFRSDFGIDQDVLLEPCNG
eukprot:snap_masked-scaffold_38-processed-gene-2.37-mRNA-1 protein AED:1.00 eAED:1.00 QI:0/-1/0/0/-1/1/1/0/247